jgi:hypothetical protein
MDKGNKPEVKYEKDLGRESIKTGLDKVADNNKEGYMDIAGNY